MFNSMKTTTQYREDLRNAGRKAVKELIKVAEEKIVGNIGDPLSLLAADRLKNAAAAKKLAITDAFDILKKIDDETNYREELISAGRKAVDELIKVAESPIIKNGEDMSDPLSVDRLKNAAATKKLAINDAYDILRIIDDEQAALEDDGTGKILTGGFAERRAK